MGRKVNYERGMRSRNKATVYLEGDTLAKGIAYLQELAEQYGMDATLGLTCEQYSDSDKEYLRVFTQEPETDAEMAKRIADEEEWSRRDDERDAADYKRLQEKFGAK